jgi:CBS domain-containing protein
MSQQNVQAVRGLYDAFNRGDLDTMQSGFSRDLLWNEAENSLYSAGNPYRSFEAVSNGVFAPTARDFDQFRCDLEQLLDAGDYVIGTGRYRGRCKDTGKELSAQFCHVMRLDGDGKLAGVLTDGDLKRILLKHPDPLAMRISGLMNAVPRTIGGDATLAEAVRLMEDTPPSPITSLVVVDSAGRPRGVVHLHDCLRPARR